jgi:3-methyladenine DNA glycosylase AlkD
MTERQRTRRPTLGALRRELRAEADADDAVHLQRFFKTGPGQYGEGDRFLGVRVPVLRRLARDYRTLPADDALALLQSRWHEERLLGLLLLVGIYQRGLGDDKQAVYDAYLAHTRHINNWDLVDASAEHIVGPHVSPDRVDVLERLARSPDLWERRIAMLATFYWIKQGQFAPALRIATLLLADRHDLIHKAVGWMLREIGKRDRAVEKAFLQEHYRAIPRTALRYAIEHFPEPERRRYLAGAI